MSLMAAALVSFSASATDFQLIGGFNSWNTLDETSKFTDKGDGTYVLEYKGIVASGFKIKSWGKEWDDTENYGAPTADAVLKVGESLTLLNGQGSKNINTEGGVSLTNPKFTFNPTALTLLVEAGTAEAVISYDIWGNLDGGEYWASTKLTETDGVWSASNVEVKEGANFGIRELSDGSQSNWFAATSAVTISETTTVDMKVDGTNLKIEAGTYDFSFNPSELKLAITKVSGGGGDEPIIPDPEYKDLYLVGAQFGWDFASTEAYKFERNENVYTITVDAGMVGGATEKNWKIWDGTWDYNFGCGEEQPVAGVEYETWFDGGDFTFSTEPNVKTTITFTLVKGSDEKNSSIPSKLLIDVPNSVENIEAVEEGTVRYFNLQGVEVSEPANGVFVRVANGKATKVVK